MRKSRKLLEKWKIWISRFRRLPKSTTIPYCYKTKYGRKCCSSTWKRVNFREKSVL